METQKVFWEQAFNEMKYQRDQAISKEKEAAMLELADIVQGILTYKTEQHFVLKDRLCMAWEKWRAA